MRVRVPSETSFVDSFFSSRRRPTDSCTRSCQQMRMVSFPPVCSEKKSLVIEKEWLHQYCLHAELPTRAFCGRVSVLDLPSNSVVYAAIRSLLLSSRIICGLWILNCIGGAPLVPTAGSIHRNHDKGGSHACVHVCHLMDPIATTRCYDYGPALVTPCACLDSRKSAVRCTSSSFGTICIVYSAEIEASMAQDMSGKLDGRG